jgi:hypothetical protein
MSLLPALLLSAAGAMCSADSGLQSAVVVELYTSQGCSSCPPADRWLSTLRARHGDRVIPLSMHVGYWDYIGWKDPFARREFNERQRLLATASGSRTVYTPGVFVQGREFAAWARTATFDAAVQAALRRTAVARLEIALQETTAAAVTVRASGQAPSGARLWLALVQNGLTTAVRAGENRGETLANDHVVRDWQGPFAVGDVTGRLPFPPSNGSTATERWAVVALVDDPTGRSLQAVHLPLAGCGAAQPPGTSRGLPQNSR